MPNNVIPPKCPDSYMDMLWYRNDMLMSMGNGLVFQSISSGQDGLAGKNKMVKNHPLLKSYLIYSCTFGCLLATQVSCLECRMSGTKWRCNDHMAVKENVGDVRGKSSIHLINLRVWCTCYASYPLQTNSPVKHHREVLSPRV